MKNQIYNEIQILENKLDIIQKKKGRAIRILAENISCFKCMDTQKNWKNNLQSTSLNNNGNYDIVGCPNCNNIGLITHSYTNNIMHNGLRIFHIDNNNWMDRIEKIHNKASGDVSIINKVNEWINKINKIKVEQIEQIDQIDQIEPVKFDTIKKEPIVEIKPIFEVCKRITKDYTEKSLVVDIEVGKIIEIVKNAVEAYFGNIFSLGDLAKELRISFSISNGKSITNDKLIKIKENNYLGIKTCTKITQNIIKTGLFGKNKFAKEYTADIFILKPLNQKAIEKANIIMGKIGEEMTDDILRDF